MTDRPDEASKLACLLRDIEELERTRTALLQRVDRTRAELIASGNRTAAIKATVDLLCEHLTDVVAAASEISLLEQEIRETDRNLDDAQKTTNAHSFEFESFQQTLDEEDEELERLSSILVDRRGKHSKGH
jgi:chromosome segregation ATPase